MSSVSSGEEKHFLPVLVKEGKLSLAFDFIAANSNVDYACSSVLSLSDSMSAELILLVFAECKCT